MKFSRLCRAFLLASVSVPVTMSAVLPARADTLIVQRGDTLFLDDLSGVTPERKFLTIGSAPGTMWAASPDGRRIVWVTRQAPAATASTGIDFSTLTGLAARPVIAHVSDLAGRHEKRLFSTSSLSDRQGHKVTALDISGADSSESGIGKFDDWEPASLSWSADSRTVYLSCVSQGADGGGKATFATDGAAGTALVDADERWRSLAPVTSLDARSGILAGSGLSRFTVSSEPGTPQRYTPVVIIDLAAGVRTPLYAASGDSKDLPDCAFAADCELSPDTRTVAFVGASKGLWLVDRRTRVYRRLVDGAILSPRWSRDGKQILFLLPRPAGSTAAAGGAPVYDLYAVIPPPPSTISGNALATVTAATESLPLRLIMQNVDGFATLLE